MEGKVLMSPPSFQSPSCERRNAYSAMAEEVPYEGLVCEHLAYPYGFADLLECRAVWRVLHDAEEAHRGERREREHLGRLVSHADVLADQRLRDDPPLSAQTIPTRPHEIRRLWMRLTMS